LLGWLGEKKDMNLVDNFGRKHTYLRISITDACNFRCTYCTSGKTFPVTPRSQWMLPHEIQQIAESFIEMGIQKIRITGGEPLVRKDAAEIFQRLGDLPVELALTTNGVFLPKFIDQFEKIGLNKINVSLDSLDPLEFYRIVGVDDFQKVKNAIQLAVQRGFEVKINAVPTQSTSAKEILDFVQLTQNQNVEVRMIEMMPFSGNDWDRNQVLTKEEILNILSNEYSFSSIPKLKEETAQLYQIDGFKGKIGIISTVSDPFCEGCNRLRITADGKLKNCLFGKREDDLLGRIRRGEPLHEIMIDNVRAKHAQTGGQVLSSNMENRSMIAIGG
jgi:cyclic pyranopterin phosphate synthase